MQAYRILSPVLLKPGRSQPFIASPHFSEIKSTRKESYQKPHLIILLSLLTDTGVVRVLQVVAWGVVAVPSCQFH